MKKCNKCKKEKELKEYWKDKANKTGYANICKKCSNNRRSGKASEEIVAFDFYY